MIYCIAERGVIEVGYTIATHNGSAVAREHNIRNEKVVSKESHIEPNGHFEIWHDEKVRDAYHRLFDDAVERYNAKQTRDDRKIDNYYNNIAKDAKKHTAYEMIISIGNRDNMCDEQTGKAIMRDFVDSWRERNPNLELIGAYYHNDEQGVPHVHCDYIPVAHGYSRGMETQTGLVKALGEMGFHKQGKATAQIQWEKRENQTLEDLCKARGLEIDHPLEENRQHMHTELYKAQQELSNAIDHTNDLDERNNALERQLERYTGDIKQAKDVQKVGKPMPFNKIMIDRSDYDSLVKTATAVSNVIEYEKRVKKRETEVKKNYDDSKRELENAKKARETAEQQVKQMANRMAKDMLIGVDEDERKKIQRLEKYLKSLQLSDGTRIVSAYDLFLEQEKTFENNLKTNARRSLKGTIEEYEKRLREERRDPIRDVLNSAREIERSEKSKDKGMDFER